MRLSLAFGFFLLTSFALPGPAEADTANRKTGLVYHEDFLKHDMGPDHPERPDRLRAIMAGLDGLPSVARPHRTEGRGRPLDHDGAHAHLPRVAGGGVETGAGAARS